MPAIRLTLQNRITTLMIVSSVILISTFTFIQLNNQLNNLIRYNSYQANLSSVIVKNNLETVLRKASAPDMPKFMQSSLDTLRETNVINKAVIFDKDGQITASTQQQLAGHSVRYTDLNKWQDLQNSQENRWFISQIDELTHDLDMFIALKSAPQEPIMYLAKISFSLGNIQEAFSGIYRNVLFASIFIIIANILIGYIISKTVIGPIKILNEVTKMIAGGNLSVRIKIRTNDELEEMGLTFNHMTEELIKMKERAENANPLTKLPGNIVIQEKIEKRITEDQKFTVIYCDLDNFKAFNDKYGIAKGDEAIKMAAQILKESVKEGGNPDDFIGHEGGDDFILVSTPVKAQEIADFITREFDQRIRSLYDPDDAANGFITAHSRDGSIKQFPIMTISLAGVSNENRVIASYGEVTNIAAEVKKKAKSIGQSVFIMDKRHS